MVFNMESNNLDVQSSINSSIQSMNESLAYAGAPVFGLRECLNKHTKDRLSVLAKILGVEKYSSLKKAELVAAVAEKLTDASMLASILTEVDEAEFVLFQNAADNSAVKFRVAEHRPFHALHLFGIAAAFLKDGAITIIVPDEIKSTWAELKTTGFSEEKLRGELIHKYAYAAVNLYGAIGIDALIALIERLEGVAVEIETAKPALLEHIARSRPYYLWNDFVVNAVFGDDVDSLEQLLASAADFPRYVPEKSEFLEYFSPIYYEDTPQNNAMAVLLGGVVGDEHLAGILTGDLRTLLAAGISDDGCYNMLRSSGITGTSKEMTELMMNMRLATRLWETRGHTIGAAPKKSELGRNDKCPCGSGAKYKKCCAG